MAYDSHVSNHGWDERFGWSRMEPAKEVDDGDLVETEVLAAEVSVGCDVDADNTPVEPSAAIEAIDRRLQQLDSELERYTADGGKEEYAYAAACGILTGAVDSLLFGGSSVHRERILSAYEHIEGLVKKYSKSGGQEPGDFEAAMRTPGNVLPAILSIVWSGKGFGVSTEGHQLSEIAARPTVSGLIASLALQFTKTGVLENKDEDHAGQKGEDGDKETLSVERVMVPVAITGILNWLLAISDQEDAGESGEKLPRSIKRLAGLAASTPAIAEIAKCASNWLGKQICDAGKPSKTIAEGMGITGVFLSMLKEISTLPPFADSGLSETLNGICGEGKADLHHNLVSSGQLKEQSIPVVFNEVLVRAGYLVINLIKEVREQGDLQRVDWSRVVPLESRTVDRMIAIAAMTFSVVDTGDAAIRAAVESGTNWIIFSERFVARYNYVGAARAAVAIVKEFSNEKKEAELIHEKRLLMEAKAEAMYDELQAFKARLSEKLVEYLVEDIEVFMAGFDDMNEGLATNNSDLVIRGNVKIQRVLGREPQFTTQAEFDDLMDSDIPLEL